MWFPLCMISAVSKLDSSEKLLAPAFFLEVQSSFNLSNFSTRFHINSEQLALICNIYPVSNACVVTTTFIM